MSSRDLTLFVNGKAHFVSPDCTVQGLLEHMGLIQRRIAVAVNRDVVSRSTYPTHRLAAGDHVEILEAVGGG